MMRKLKLNLLLSFLLGMASPAYADDLLEIYQKALISDPNLQTAKLEFELSEAQQGQAGSALLPQASANANVSYNSTSVDAIPGTREFDGYRYSVSITQSMFDVSKFSNWLRYQALTDKSQVEYQQAQQILMFDVVDRYLNVLIERDNLVLNKQEIGTTERNLHQIKRQFEKSVVTVTDVYEMEAKLDALMAEQIEAETKLDIAKQNLKELTGSSFGLLSELREDAQFLVLQGDVQEIAEQAQQNNLLIHAQNKEIEAADYNVISQKAKHLPVVDLQLQYYNTDTGFQNAQTAAIATKVAAINVTIPLFSGGATYYQGQEASRQLRISKQKRIHLLRAIEKEARDAFLSANASVKRIKAQKKALSTAVKAREAMEKGFKYGMQSIGDVLISQAREYAAKRDLFNVKYIYIKNRIRYEQASGRLSIDSLETINQWLRV